MLKISLKRYIYGMYIYVYINLLGESLIYQHYARRDDQRETYL